MSDQTAGSASNGTLDADALDRKYREEREKRVRVEGNDQYHVVDAEHSAEFLEDPYARNAQREARDVEVEVAIVGGGFGGLLSAVRLQEAGIEDVLIIDKAADFGGTWYWNRYPGVECDIESYIYMPLLEETGRIPSRRYASGAEILRHAQAIGKRYDLYSRSLLETTVTGMVWKDGDARWELSTSNGDTIRARFVCISPGLYPWPKLPGIEGIDTFKGKSFHTSRWDYGYTGGGPDDEVLDRLGDKTVGVIGTGATALQCIPVLGRNAKQVYVFQRTPSTVGQRDNRPTDPEFASNLTPGWQRERMDSFNATLSGQSTGVDLVDDCWTRLFSLFHGLYLPDPDTAKKRQLVDFEAMEKLRGRVESIVQDPATAESLKPWYNLLCKRPGFHDGYLQAFNNHNVTLVDTQGHGVERLTETGVVANGVEYPVDCLIYATGFEFINSRIDHRLGFDIVGRDGQTLSGLWERGYSSLYGLHMHGFPNCFILGNAQQAVTPNYTYLHEELSRHVAFLVTHARERGIRTMESTLEAEQAWVDKVTMFGPVHERLARDCTPSYINNEGKVSDRTARNSFYMGGATAYNKLLAEWRADPNMPGIQTT